MPRAETPVVVAVDGPAASGKGTIARRLAAHLGYAYLDTGLLYRAAARKLLDQGGDPADPAAALAAAQAIEAGDLAGEGLRDPAVGDAASVIAAHGEVRAALLAYQRNFASAPPGGAPGAVLDGRDIGTVICPDAAVKVFIDASVEVRAERRFRELQDQGVESIYSRVLRDMEARDARDRSRSVAPLVPAEDALVVDTSALDADAVFQQVLAYFSARMMSEK